MPFRLNICLCLYRRAEGTPIYLSSHLIDRLESLNNDAWMIQYFLAHAIMRACMHAVMKPKHLRETYNLCRWHGAEDACNTDCTSTEARPLYELEFLYFATPEHREWQMDADICWHLHTGVTDGYWYLLTPAHWVTDGCQHVIFLELDLNFSGVVFHTRIIDSHVNFVLGRVFHARIIDRHINKFLSILLLLLPVASDVHGTINFANIHFVFIS